MNIQKDPIDLIAKKTGISKVLIQEAFGQPSYLQLELERATTLGQCRKIKARAPETSKVRELAEKKAKRLELREAKSLGDLARLRAILRDDSRDESVRKAAEENLGQRLLPLARKAQDERELRRIGRFAPSGSAARRIVWRKIEEIESRKLDGFKTLEDCVRFLKNKTNDGRASTEAILFSVERKALKLVRTYQEFLQLMDECDLFVGLAERQRASELAQTVDEHWSVIRRFGNHSEGDTKLLKRSFDAVIKSFLVRIARADTVQALLNILNETDRTHGLAKARSIAEIRLADMARTMIHEPNGARKLLDSGGYGDFPEDVRAKLDEFELSLITDLKGARAFAREHGLVPGNKLYEAWIRKTVEVA